MPLFGTLDPDAAFADAPVMAGLAPDAWSLPGADLVQVSYEVEEDPALAVTPSSLHPSIPPYATFTVARFPTSPVGPFTLAMVRLVVRAGIRPRGLLMAAFADAPEAVEALRTGWGYRIRPAELDFHRRYGSIGGSVTIDGTEALRVNLDDPEPVSGGDLELFDNLHLATVDGEGPLIVQVDPTYQYANADRGGADLAVYEPELLGTTGIIPDYPVVAVACRADVDLDAPRFVIDPARPAVQGTRRLATAG